MELKFARIVYSFNFEHGRFLKNMQYKMISLFSVLLILYNSTALSQEIKQLAFFENPEFLSAPKGYSHVARIDLGNAWMLIISGQVSLDKEGNLVGKGDFARQTEQIYQNIMEIIKAAGGNKDHLIKTGIFILDNSNMPILREIRNKYINLKNPPASTLVQVSKLYRDDLLIEIEATAVIPKK